jgi:hypothetical protein
MLPMAAILTKNSQVTMAKWSQSLLSPESMKFCSTQNHIEILVPIILGRFPINKNKN